jgi:hypothetical protein
MKNSTSPYSHTILHIESHTAEWAITLVIHGFDTGGFGCNPRPVCKYCPAPFSHQLNKSLCHGIKKVKVEQKRYCEVVKYYYTSIIVFKDIKRRNPSW